MVLRLQHAGVGARKGTEQAAQGAELQHDRLWAGKKKLKKNSDGLVGKRS